MKIFSSLLVFFLNLSPQLIKADLEFDGQVTCVFGKIKQKKAHTIFSGLASANVSKEDVKYFIYEKAVNDRNLDPVQIHPDDVFSLQYGNFDTSKLTKIFIHGFKSHRAGSSSHLVREGFFKNGDFNVIIVDWSAAQHRGPIHWTYDAVVKKLDAVGKHVADMLLFLEENGLDLGTTTVVGHSLGAHVAGVAGHLLHGRIGRLVGLDPAGPLMSTKTNDQRLSKDDAMQVEVIHSEIDHCGLNRQMGHYDIYPNSGRLQPGCESYSCAHSRAYEYFAESLDPNSKGCYARVCDDWQSMQNGKCEGEVVVMGGLDTKSAEHGLYYVQTNEYSPYAQGLR